MHPSIASSCELVLPLGSVGGLEEASAMAGLRWQLQCFGTVAAVERSEAGLLVRYTDSWAAAAARKAFGVGAWAEWEETSDSCAYAGGMVEGGASGREGEEGGEDSEGAARGAERDAAEIEAFKPSDLCYWGWDAIPTQASLTPLSEQDSVATLLGYLSPTASSADLQSLGDSEADAAAGEPMSLTPLSEEDEGLQDNTAVGQNSSTAAPRRASTVSLSSGPKFLRGLELSHLNWDRLAKGQEWRRDLMLRGLPQQFCKKENMEAFLAAKGLRELVTEIRVTPGKGLLKPGSAVLFAVSADATARLAKFFHGAQLPGARSPVAVGFAPGQPLRASSRLEPMRVPSGREGARRGLPLGVPLPPGLEC